MVFCCKVENRLIENLLTEKVNANLYLIASSLHYKSLVLVFQCTVNEAPFMITGTLHNDV